MIFRSKIFWNFCVFVCVVVLIAPLVPAYAQNSDNQDLSDRVNRLQREISTLQRYMYKRPPPSIVPRKPTVAGAMASGSRGTARNSTRITQLEDTLRQLTGQMEEVGFSLKKIQDRLNKLVSDMDQRLTGIEGDLRNASSSSLPNSTRRPNTPNTPVGSTVSSAVRLPGVLGKIPRSLAVNAPRGPAIVPAMPPNNVVKVSKPVLPPGTPRSQYDYAVSLLLQERDYKKAEPAFRAFIAKYPNNKLTSNAHYWLAETYYVRTSYKDAAFAFAEGLDKFPKGTKAPHSLLKLGMSLGRLERLKEACMTFQRLQKNFPEASVRLKARVDRELRRARCS